LFWIETNWWTKTKWKNSFKWIFAVCYCDMKVLNSAVIPTKFAKTRRKEFCNEWRTNIFTFTNMKCEIIFVIIQWNTTEVFDKIPRGYSIVKCALAVWGKRRAMVPTVCVPHWQSEEDNAHCLHWSSRSWCETLCCDSTPTFHDDFITTGFRASSLRVLQVMWSVLVQIMTRWWISRRSRFCLRPL
jgi:hypothetical protein